MKATDSDQERPSYWQLVFLQSKVNGAAYTGEELPGRNWDWPKNTYLQRRLRRHKFPRPSENFETELVCRFPRCLLQHSSRGNSGRH